MASPQVENGYTKIANEIIEALAKIRINGEARQMLDVIIRKTYGFNKKQDRISTSQFVEATGLPYYAIHKARHKLLKMGIIEVLPKKVIGITQKGNSQILTYSFQKDYTKWQPLPKKVTVTQKGNGYNPKRSQTVTQKAYHKRNKETIQKKEGIGSPTAHLTNSTFIDTLKNSIAYKHINVGQELAKMDAWLLVHKGRKKTPKFVVNWLNRIDKPLEPEKERPQGAAGRKLD